MLTYVQYGEISVLQKDYIFWRRVGRDLIQNVEINIVHACMQLFYDNTFKITKYS